MLCLGAKEGNIAIIPQEVSVSSRLDQALKKLLPQIDTLWLIPDPVVISSREAVKKIFNICDNSNIPILAYDRVYLELGASVVIAPDTETTGRQAGILTKDILAGKIVSDRLLSVAGSDIILNLKSVIENRLKLNDDALDSINQIIE